MTQRLKPQAVYYPTSATLASILRAAANTGVVDLQVSLRVLWGMCGQDGELAAAPAGGFRVLGCCRPGQWRFTRSPLAWPVETACTVIPRTAASTPLIRRAPRAAGTPCGVPEVCLACELQRCTEVSGGP